MRASTLPQSSRYRINILILLVLFRQLDCLPPVLSYSPVEITLTSRAEKSSHAPGGHSARLLRRDLFDARFQLANRDDDSDDEGSSFGNMIPRNLSPPKGILGGLGAANGDSSGSADLVKGVYEGGLKTWEASLDLVVCTDSLGVDDKSPFEDHRG